jgi:endogenous inhibitor of DNA gyrase (YacG/DUF329 family)
MSTKFYCNSETCTHADKGPFVLELAQEAVMDGNNLATIFCPRCGNPMKELPENPQKDLSHNRYYCHNNACGSNENGPFFIDLPSEAIMDKNNLATIFCPKCAKEMKPFDQQPGAAINF